MKPTDTLDVKLSNLIGYELQKKNFLTIQKHLSKERKQIMFYCMGIVGRVNLLLLKLY